jgi:hypothetical protein
VKALEHSEQVSLMKWWALACHGFGLHENTLFAIPNGGARNAVTGMNLKREGVRAGVPDLFLAWANRQYGGLFIEMKKTKGGRVSDAQKQYLELLEESGYKVAVCHGWLEAKASIEEYLK